VETGLYSAAEYQNAGYGIHDTRTHRYRRDTVTVRRSICVTWNQKYGAHKVIGNSTHEYRADTDTSSYIRVLILTLSLYFVRLMRSALWDNATVWHPSHTLTPQCEDPKDMLCSMYSVQVHRLQFSANCLMIISVISTQYTSVTDSAPYRAAHMRRAVKNLYVTDKIQNVRPTSDRPVLCACDLAHIKSHLGWNSSIFTVRRMICIARYMLWCSVCLSVHLSHWCIVPKPEIWLWQACWKLRCYKICGYKPYNMRDKVSIEL